MKNDEESLFAYIKNIPTKTVETIFKKAEVPTEVFTGIIKTIVSKGVGSAEDQAWSGKFMLSLTKAKNFEMTLMFAGDADNKNIEEIVEKISEADSELAEKVKTEYTAE